MTVKEGPGTFNRPGFSPGTMAMVQLFSQIPWIYHEVGSGSGLSSDQKNKYRKGLLEGVKKSLQSAGDANSQDNSSPAGCTNAVGAQKIAEIAVSLAWPEDRGLVPKPEYEAAVREHNPERISLLADCGTFVSTVILASGVDDNFPPGYTPSMEDYVRSNPDKWDVVDRVTSTSDLQPGDILIVNAPGGGAGASGHTWIYVGPQEPNGYDAASASLNSRTGNLGKQPISDYRGDYLRARLK